MSHRFIAVAERCACIRALMRNKGLPRAAVVFIRHCLNATQQAYQPPIAPLVAPAITEVMGIWSATGQPMTLLMVPRIGS